MRSARSSRSLPPERTACPHCGRDTQTSTDGVCAECWGRKRSGPRLHPASRRERGYFWAELDDFLAGLFGDDYGGWLALSLLGLLVGAVVLALLEGW